MLPLPWRKATWLPSGALGLAEVQCAAVAADPGRSGELPGRTIGRVLEGIRGQPRQLETAVADRVRPPAIATSSTKAVLSPPNGFKPTSWMVCVPAVVTVKLGVWYKPYWLLAGVTRPTCGAVDQHLDLLIMLVWRRPRWAAWNERL